MTRKAKQTQKRLLQFGRLLLALGEVAAGEVFVGLSHSFVGWETLVGASVDALTPDIMQAACESCPGLWFQPLPPRYGAPVVMVHAD